MNSRANEIPRVAMLMKNLANNGITNVAINYGEKLIQEGFSLDFIVGGEINGSCLRSATSKGIRVLELPNKKRLIKYLIILTKYFKIGNYDIVHIHGNSGAMILEAVIARRYTKVLATHCHNTRCNHPLVHKVFRHKLSRISDLRYACSEEAGKWLFSPYPFEVIPNAFDVNRFRYSADKRKAIRKECGIPENAFLVGNVARLNAQKNYPFLIEVFKKIHQLVPDSWLLIVGDGPEEKHIKSKIKSSGLEESIIMLGSVSDSSEVYSGLDCFIFPSLFEGLGISLVEAQIEGCLCFASSNVPKSAAISENCRLLSLSSGPEKWAYRIVSDYKKKSEVRSMPKDSDIDLYRIDIQYLKLVSEYKSSLLGVADD